MYGQLITIHVEIDVVWRLICHSNQLTLLPHTQAHSNENWLWYYFTFTSCSFLWISSSCLAHIFVHYTAHFDKWLIFMTKKEQQECGEAGGGEWKKEKKWLVALYSSVSVYTKSGHIIYLSGIREMNKMPTTIQTCFVLMWKLYCVIYYFCFLHFRRHMLDDNEKSILIDSKRKVKSVVLSLACILWIHRGTKWFEISAFCVPFHNKHDWLCVVVEMHKKS